MQYEIRKVDDELTHYGREGMHWGIRQYQYKDGSLTPLGRIHYGYGEAKKSVSKWAIKAKKNYDKSDEAFKKWVDKQVDKHNTRKEKRAEKKEQKKEYLIEHGTAKEISKNMKKFNEDDLKRIQTRFDTQIKVQQNIDTILGKKNVPVEKVKNATENVKKKKSSLTELVTNATKFIVNNAGNLKNSIDNAKNFYNTVAYINNSLRRNNSGGRGLYAGDPGFMTIISTSPRDQRPDQQNNNQNQNRNQQQNNNQNQNRNQQPTPRRPQPTTTAPRSSTMHRYSFRRRP